MISSSNVTQNAGSTLSLNTAQMCIRDRFKIVGSTEANSLQNKISNESPVGRALLGRKAGETVEVETQAGVIEYKILEIQRVS